MFSKRKTAESLSLQQEVDQDALWIAEAKQLKVEGIQYAERSLVSKALVKFSAAIRKLELVDPALSKYTATSRAVTEHDTYLSDAVKIPNYDVKMLRGSLHEMRSQLLMSKKTGL